VVFSTVEVCVPHDMCSFGGCRHGPPKSWRSSAQWELFELFELFWLLFPLTQWLRSPRLVAIKSWRSMAPLSFSPEASISSHTLSVGSAQPQAMPLQKPLADQFATLFKTPNVFLQPNRDVRASFLAAAKQFVDPVAAGVSEAQSQRQQELRRKRKRGQDHDEDSKVLQLKRIHTDGFGVDQVFEQARKIVDATSEENGRFLPVSEGYDQAIPDDSESELDEDAEEVEEYMGDSDTEEEMLDDEDASHEDVATEDEEHMLSDGSSDSEEPAEEYHPDPNALNDGFFSIDQFNKQSEFLEQQDARGEPVASDDEEIDWDGDPFKLGHNSTGKKGGEDHLSEDGSEEDGPTFGNVRLDAPEGESDEEDDLQDVTNANNVLYADFFAPPAKKASKNNIKKKGRPNPHNFPSAADPQNNKPEREEEDVGRTISAVHRDLFEDDDDAESEGDLTDLDPSDPKARRSAHERRQAKLAEEIRKLESANVAKRQWQLSGEARAADRPINSLLEEDLDFERAGKPVPVITAEISEDIEALIKRRILSSEFDEVRRRRPDDLATGSQVRRGQFELEDTKSGKGLAEMYEEEHLRQTDPNYVDARDEKLKKEHAEIEAMWKSVSRKLDSLSSWHYKPKPAAPNLEIRVDAPAIEMEDARPTAGGEVAGSSMLAPQELYKPGEEKNNAEIVTKSGMPTAREEMTREQKLRRRRREKERIKKANLNETPKETGAEKTTKEKKQVVGALKRGGVQVIGKKGQLTDVEGQKVKDKARSGAGNFKL
jgi:U3 small nucleolar RNA-associated protein MPP10